MLYNKVQDSVKKEAGSGKRNFNNKININNKMKVSGSRLTADSVCVCVYQSEPTQRSKHWTFCSVLSSAS